MSPPPDASASDSSKRKHIRFKPDPLAYALIDSREGASEFVPDHVALIADEAPMGGCGLIAGDIDHLQMHSICRVKLGELAPLRAEVVWRKAIDHSIVRIGFSFLE